MRTVRRRRGALLCGTALQAVAALAFVGPATAQLAPTTRPIGGQVVAGSAAIGQTTAQTTINQRSQRAAIEWQSFDVGSQHTVQFNQPNANAVTLNRVTGPDPSQIAGQIIANGNIIITNPSGVVFHDGAQVNANSLIASAPGITNQNFMAGRMVFDQAPKPGARVSNAGTITVKQAGLAALVAPQVANSGTINARLGRVVLAGAEAHTIDLYGDGLVSIDVTKQVTTTPLGPDGKPVTALVTNTGTVIADGGSVLITARAADGIVQNLISAGGTVQANSVGGRTGTVTIAGVGGSVRIEGRVAADGASGPGGAITVGASETVTVAPTARISANGTGGGGTVALGTTTARALAGRQSALANVAGPGTPAGTAKRVVVAAGATVSADGTGSGSGGTVTLLSTDTTQIDGKLTARAGSAGGDGGVIETSSDGVLSLNAAPDASAPAGKPGTLFIDPYDLIVTDNPPDVTTLSLDRNNSVPPDNSTSGTSYITPQTLQNANNNGATLISLYANHDLTVQSAVNLASGSSSTGGSVSGASLLLHANNTLTIGAPITLSSTANLTLYGGSTMLLQDTLTASTVSLTGTAAITQSGGSIVTNTLTGNANTASLTAANQVSTLSAFTTTGSFSLTNASNLVVNGSVSVGSGATLTLASSNLGFALGGSLTAPGGSVTLLPNTPGNGFALTSSSNNPLVTASTLQVGTPAGVAVSFSGSFNFSDVGTVSVQSAAGISEDVSSSIQANTLTGQGNSASFFGTNTIGTLGSFSTTNGLSLTNSQGLTVAGPVTANNGTISLDATALTLTGTLNAPTVLLNATNDITQPSGSVTAGTLTGSAANATLGSTTNAITNLGIFTTSGGFTLADASALTVTGQVSVGSGQTLSLASGSVSVATTGPSINGGLVAPGGLIILQPDGAGQTLALNAGALPANRLTANRLQIGNAAGGDVTLTGAFNLTNIPTLDLRSAGAIGGSATIDVATLIGGAGSVSLPGANAIATLGAFTTSNGLVLADVSSLTVAGPVSAGGTLALQSGGSLTLNGAVSGPTVSLTSSNALTQSAAGVITAGTLTGGAGSVGGGATLTSANQVDTLGDFTSAGGFSLTNTRALAVTGAVSATQIVLNNTGAVTISGSLSAPTVQLLVAGDITQPSGSISTTTLSGQATNAALTSPSNQVTNLGGFTTTGNFSLADASNLTVTGFVSVGSGQTLSLASNSIGFNEGGSLYAPGGTVALAPNTTGAAFALSSFANTSNITASTLRIGSLTTGDITISGTYNFSSVDTLDLRSGGAINEDAASSIQVATLTGQAASANLLGSNAVTTLGSFTATDGFAFVNGQPLTVAGPVGAGAVLSLQSIGGLTLNGPLNGSTVSLTTTGTITQASTGIITAGILTGNVTPTTGSVTGGSASLNADNVIASLGNFSTTTGFSLTNARALDVVGPVTDNTQITLANTGAVTLSGTLNAPTVSLTVDGDITQPSGSITATTLTGSAATASLTSGSNQVTGLGTFSTTGDFSLADASTLTVRGQVSVGSGQTLSLASDAISVVEGGSLYAAGGTVALAPNTPGAAFALSSFSSTNNVTASTLRIGSPTTGDITISGTYNFSSVDTLDLRSGGAINEDSTSSIQVATLTGQAASASLAGGNAIGTLRDFTTTGDLTLSNATALVVAGTVTGGTVSLSSADTLTLTGTLSGTSVALAAVNGLSQDGGSIATATLTGSVGGGGTTLGSANAIDTLGSFSSHGGFSLTNGAALTITGPVSDDTSVAFNNVGALTLNGTITAPFVQLVATDITQPGGSIVATSLTGSATTASLTSLTNQITHLASFDTAGDFSLADASNLTVTGFVSVGGGQTLSLASNSIGFGEGGSLYALGGTVALAPNTPGAAFTLSSFSDTSNVTASTLRIGSVTTGDITISGNYVFSNVDTLDLRSGGAINEDPASSIQVATLTGQAASANFAGGNAIGELHDFTTTTVLNLVDTSSLLVSGTVAGGAVSLSSEGTIALTGILSGDSVALSAATGLTQDGGFISAGTLTGSVGGGGAALNSANLIGTLGSFTSNGGFSLTNAQALIVSGPVTDAATITLNVTGGLALTGTLQTSLITLNASADLTQGGGALIATTLTGSAANATLTGANQVSNLGPFTTTGNFSLADASSLTVAGAVSVGGGGTLSLASDSIGFVSGGSLAAPGGTVSLAPYTPGAAFALSSFSDTSNVTASTLRIGSLATGDITISGTYDFSSVDTLDLRSGGAITETSGSSLRVGTLTGQAGSAALDGDNAIATLGRFATNTGFRLNDTQPLTVTGPVSGNAAVALTTAGTLTLSGTLSAPSVSLTAAGDVVQAGGSITAGTLSASVRGAATLNSAANAIGALGPFSSGSGLVLVDQIGLSLNGDVTAPSISLTVAGDISQAGGRLATGTLSGSGATVTLTQSGNQIGALGGFTAQNGFSLASSGDLALAGNLSAPTVTLTVDGAISQTGGTLSIGTLSGTAVGSAVFGGAGIANVGTLGPFSVGNGGAFAAGATIDIGSTTPAAPSEPTGVSLLSLADSSPLVVDGPLSAGTITISSPGTLTLDNGTITADAASFQVTPGMAGAVLNQLGTTTVNPASGGTGQLTLALPSGGAVSLSQLNAPSMAVTLQLGSGSASGALNVASLQVTGSGGSATLTGTVAGQTGGDAATAAGISPAVNSAYQLNNCTISASCGMIILPPNPPPPPEEPALPLFLIGDSQAAAITPKSFLDSTLGNILKTNLFTVDLITVGILRDPSDPELLLPNISDRDY